MRRELIIQFIVLIIFGSCQSVDTTKTDSYYEGTIHVSADESFKPVVDSQVQVYEAARPNAHIKVTYKPEAECLQDLLNDSIRMVTITRKITTEEKNLVADSMNVVVSQMVIAYDAIAVIVNPTSPDSLFTISELKQILTGNFNKTLIPVFDGLKATSTIRFIVDSVLRGDSLTSKALAAKSSEEVIEYVARTPNAIGFIGVSWIGNKEDPQQLSFLTKVRLAQLESTDKPGSYILPVQANIYMGRYPLIRELVYILKETDRTGLGHGFASQLTGEVGQLIFRRAYLVPALMKFGVRSTVVSEKDGRDR